MTARWQWIAPETRVFPFHGLVGDDGLPHPECAPGDVVASDEDLAALGFVPADGAPAPQPPEPAAPAAADTEE